MSDIGVRLPDGRVLEVPVGASVLDVAARIGKRLARDALAGRIDGRFVDLRTPVNDGAAVEIVTARDPEGGEVIRHSAEHVMADAVKRLFPEALVDVGRTDHSDKFQYDFRVNRPFSPEDLDHIEAEMQRIIKDDAPFVREVVSREDATARFQAQGEELKVARIADIPGDQDITLYRHGDFVDLCRGPHVQRAGQIGAVKLLETAGAYWKGDEANEMLQRIYGTAFATRKELEAWLARLEEARKRDHRRVGVALDLFMVDAHISPGSPFYKPKGMVLYNGLVDYVKSLYPRFGYQEVMTPQVYRTELYKISGHYEHFSEDMFRMPGADEGEELAVKPMNCPGHCWLFDSEKHSYRDLPMRLAEFSRLHRNERSGTLTGLSRVRSMAQDDAHVYCTPEQVPDEIQRFFEMTARVYEDLGLSGVKVYVSTRPESFLGEPDAWDQGERSLQEGVEAAGYECGMKPGEAAFYGPKVEFDFEDVLGRAWTLSTLQIDMAMPGRFGLHYTGADGQEHEPAMLHRAILGSLERFIAIYIEHTAGDFPLWLAPVQVAVLPITARHREYAQKVGDALSDAGIRVELDSRDEKLGFKIREAETQKVPVMLVVGDQEEASGTVTPRWRRDAERKAEALAVDAFVTDLADRVAHRRS